MGWVIFYCYLFLGLVHLLCTFYEDSYYISSIKMLSAAGNEKTLSHIGSSTANGAGSSSLLSGVLRLCLPLCVSVCLARCLSQSQVSCSDSRQKTALPSGIPIAVFLPSSHPPPPPQRPPLSGWNWVTSHLWTNYWWLGERNPQNNLLN